MGCVYLARHRPTGSSVVVKLIHDHLAADPRARQSFALEVRILRRFRHPHAVTLIDASLDDIDRPFLVMEFVPGLSLAELLDQQGRLTPQHVGRLLGQLASVLQAAHDRGMLHRDLTPANMMVSEPGSPRETLKVMDFGLAHSGGFYLSLEQLQGAPGGLGGGTPDYVCPEQLRGMQVDHRGDLYSVGATLYQLLTNHVPFEGAKEVEDILAAHLQKMPPRFAAYGVTNVPPAVEAVVRRCLAKSPQERPCSARALAEEYQAALGQRVLSDDTFVSASEVDLPEELPPFNPDDVLDRFEAVLPEQIALVKLRGFVDGVGGSVVESLPGLIKVHLPCSAAVPSRSGLFSLFRPPTPPARIPIELHLAKKTVGGRGLVEVSVVHTPPPGSNVVENRAICARVCTELRAYLMIGR
jgi:serine/threonine-protein kinase